MQHIESKKNQHQLAIECVDYNHMLDEKCMIKLEDFYQMDEIFTFKTLNIVINNSF